VTLTLTSWPPRLTDHALALGEDLRRFKLKLAHSFSYYAVDKVATDEWTNKRTDGRIKGQVEIITSLASLDLHRDKYSIYSLSVLCSRVFTALSAFCPWQLSLFFTSLRNGRGEVKFEMGEVGAESGRQWRVTKTVTKTANFENTRWQTAVILKIVKSPYLSEKSSDFDEIWCNTADSWPDDSQVTKIYFF